MRTVNIELFFTIPQPDFQWITFLSEKANEVKAMAEQGINAAKDKCKVQ